MTFVLLFPRVCARVHWTLSRGCEQDTPGCPQQPVPHPIWVLPILHLLSINWPEKVTRGEHSLQWLSKQYLAVESVDSCQDACESSDAFACCGNHFFGLGTARPWHLLADHHSVLQYFECLLGSCVTGNGQVTKQDERRATRVRKNRGTVAATSTIRLELVCGRFGTAYRGRYGQIVSVVQSDVGWFQYVDDEQTADPTISARPSVRQESEDDALGIRKSKSWQNVHADITTELLERCGRQAKTSTECRRAGPAVVSAHNCDNDIANALPC
eukprot:1336059-Amphidinium_carterae.1